MTPVVVPVVENCCEIAAVTTAVLGVIEKPVPVPEREMRWGAPRPLSAIVIEALRKPVAPAVNVTLIVQVPEGGSTEPQSLVWAKSPGFAPVVSIEPMVRGAPPMFDNVTVCAPLATPVEWLPKSIAAALSETMGNDPPIGVPMSVWICVGVSATL